MECIFFAFTLFLPALLISLPDWGEKGIYFFHMAPSISNTLPLIFFTVFARNIETNSGRCSSHFLPIEKESCKPRKPWGIKNSRYSVHFLFRITKRFSTLHRPAAMEPSNSTFAEFENLLLSPKEFRWKEAESFYPPIKSFLLYASRTGICP